MAAPRLACLALVASLGACDGHIESFRTDGGRQRRLTFDGGILPEDLSTRDVSTIQARLDQAVLPSKAGDPCPHGKCAGTLICLGAVCHNTCTSPNPKCNVVASGCAADEACLSGTSFTEICYKAYAAAGAACGGDALCQAGSLCVRDAAGNARCRKLCTAGACPMGQQCAATGNGCQVCL